MHSFLLSIPSASIHSQYEMDACINLLLYEVVDLLLKKDLKEFAKDRGSLYFSHFKQKYLKGISINKTEDQTIFCLQVPFDSEIMVEPS